jgi:FKBP-type peptidyl-prolyl cis-trans isomerase FkpA
MRSVIVSVVLFLLAVPAFGADRAMTEEEKTLYAVGMMMSRQLSVFGLTGAELEIVKKGFADDRSGRKLEVDLAQYRGKVQELAKVRRREKADKQRDADRNFLEKSARVEGALKMVSGLIYRSFKEGSGDTPGPTDTVTVAYRGTFADGREFDSSTVRGKPLEAKLDGAVKCLNEGLRMMKSGGKATLVCPPELAYGDAGAGDVIPPGATLVFEVELLGIKK